MKSFKLLSFSFILLFLFACNQGLVPDETENKIITSLYPLEYIVEELAGDLVEVETIIPPGADAHSYEPSTRKMIEYASSDAFFFIGEMMEVFSETMADTLSSEGVQTLKLAEYESIFLHLDEEDHHGHDDHDHDHGDYDPHFWLSPLKMIEVGEIIRDELITLYPDDEETITTNWATFEKEMLDLDEAFLNAFVDQEPLQILVSHKAFSYLEERYPIVQHSIRGLSSSQEPSQKELQSILEWIETENIQYIFLEKNRSDRLVSTIAEDLNLEINYLNELSIRTEDQVEQGLNYVNLMMENLNTLIEVK